MIDYNIIALLYRYNTNYRMFFVKKYSIIFFPFTVI